MLSVDELKTIPLFRTLGPDDLTRLSLAGADIQLCAGDFVVHEGDEAALLVVITGRLEIIKLIDGVEKIIGERRPGVIHGEVPLVLGTAFQGGARAAEPSRVLRLSVSDYRRLAIAVPEFAEQMNALAQERIGGLKTIASQIRPAMVTVVGVQKDPASLELRRFFDRLEMRTEWIAPDDPKLADKWHGEPLRRDALPAVHCEDGTTLYRPGIRQIASRLGLHTTPNHDEYDTVIVGAGPAGLAAAVYGASEGLRTLVIEREAPGGQAGTSSRIENYLGFPSGISGGELASRAYRQAARLGAEIAVASSISSIDVDGATIALASGERVHTRSAILATGVSWRRVAIDGFDRLIGKGVYYGTARSDAAIAQGLNVHLIGAGNSAGQAAMNLANHALSVTMIVRGESLEKSMSRYLIDQIRGKQNIIVRLNAEITSVYGETQLTAVDITDRVTGEVRQEDSGGVFVFIGADAETDWLPAVIARDPRGYVLTGTDLLKHGRWAEARDPYLLETSLPGVFACGDVRLNPVKRVASAVGDGAMAIAFVHQFLQHGRSGPKRA